MFSLKDERHLVLIWDATARAWLCYRHPREIIRISELARIRPALERIEELVKRRGLHAAGFLTYEAAPAFDPILRVHSQAGSEPPLLWFGIYDWVERIAPQKAARATSSLDWTSSISEQQYHDALRRIREHLRVGDTYQVNFSFRLWADFTGHPWDFFQAICRDRPANHAAYISLPDWAVCSFSPECFFSLHGDEIISEPMKGTRARGLTLEQDLALAEELGRSAKDRAENVMITDMVRNDLGRIAVPGSVVVDRLYAVEKHATVWQMVSRVRARTKRSLAEIFRALFPAASITGAPKAASMGIIADLESAPRRVYTGSIGYISPPGAGSVSGAGLRAAFNVAIRTVLVDRRRNRAEYGVGGGIVWDSEPQGEYAECRTKARVLQQYVPDFELLETMLWTSDQGYVLLERHLARLRASAEYFDFQLDMRAVRDSLGDMSGGLARESCVIRLLLGRDGLVRVEVHPLPMKQNHIARVALATFPVQSGEPFLYHKTTYRALYEKALASKPGYDDVLLVNERGEVTESTRANILAMLEGVLYTPPVSCGLLPGTMRAQLLEQGLIVERILTPADLIRAEQVYLVNSVRGIRQVEYL